jgi:antitoxin component of RelBE/YafQ-DinJ toxin-antitoxin module
MTDLKPITVRVDPDVVADAKKEAKRLHVSLSALVDMALRKCLRLLKRDGHIEAIPTRRK